MPVTLFTTLLLPSFQDGLVLSPFASANDPWNKIRFTAHLWKKRMKSSLDEVDLAWLRMLLLSEDFQLGLELNAIHDNVPLASYDANIVN